jgi:hypothetical protein
VDDLKKVLYLYTGARQKTWIFKDIKHTLFDLYYRTKNEFMANYGYRSGEKPAKYKITILIEQIKE